MRLSASAGLVVLCAAWGSAPAMAAELVWEGHYRARARWFDSLSLSDTNEFAEGSSFSLDHRARLQPGWLLSDKVALHAQLDLLPFSTWGGNPEDIDAISGEEIPDVFTESVGPTTTEEGGATLENLRVTRLWGELSPSWGRVRFGRMPVHWGSGVLWNAGNEPDAEYGDTADRVQVTARIDQVYVIAAGEVPVEGYVNEADDVAALAAGVVYQTETAALGTYDVYRWTANKDDDTRFGMFMGDIWAWAQLGPAEFEAEVAGILGGGDLSTGANDVRLSAFGGHLRLFVPFDRVRAGLDFGVAGGDGDTTDSALHTFRFDRDFNRTLFLFEEPLPTLEASSANADNQGRDYDAVLTTEGIGNAIYLMPSVGYQIRKDLTADLSYFAATRAAVPDDEKDTRGYGAEILLDIHYKPFTYFELSGTGAVFLPGKYFQAYEDEDLGGEFNAPAFGTRVLGTVLF